MFFPGLGTAANVIGNAYHGAGPLGGVVEHFRNTPQQIPRETFSPGPYGVSVPNIGFPGMGGMGMPAGNTGVVPPNMTAPNFDPNLASREQMISDQLSANLNAVQPQLRPPGMDARMRFGSGLSGSWNMYGGQPVGQFDPRRVAGISGHAYGDTGAGRMGGTAALMRVLSGDSDGFGGGGGGGFSQEQFLNWKAGKTN